MTKCGGVCVLGAQCDALRCAAARLARGLVRALSGYPLKVLTALRGKHAEHSAPHVRTLSALPFAHGRAHQVILDRYPRTNTQIDRLKNFTTPRAYYGNSGSYTESFSARKLFAFATSYCTACSASSPARALYRKRRRVDRVEPGAFVAPSRRAAHHSPAPTAG